MRKLLLFFLIASLFVSCIMSDEIYQSTELYSYSEVDNTVLVRKGNNVWLTYVDSLGMPSKSDNVGLYVYKFRKVGPYFQIVKLEMFDRNSECLADDFTYATIKMKYTRDGKIKESKYLDCDNHLIFNELAGYARMTKEYVSPNEFITRYYDADNKPRCDNMGFEIKTRIDTIQFEINDTIVDMFQNSTVYLIDCNLDTLINNQE